jgi:hypothetical protein
MSHLVAFEMEDQFRNSYSHADFSGLVLVLIGSDKDGASIAMEWGKALGESLKLEKEEREVFVIGLSDLRGVPFFLKGYVRSKFPKKQEEWALLDWQGLFAESYGFVSGEANILVFGYSGSLIHQARFSDCESSAVEAIAAKVRKEIQGGLE